jgi:hypothetical protein
MFPPVPDKKNACYQSPGRRTHNAGEHKATFSLVRLAPHVRYFIELPSRVRVDGLLVAGNGCGKARLVVKKLSVSPSERFVAESTQPKAAV